MLALHIGAAPGGGCPDEVGDLPVETNEIFVFEKQKIPADSIPCEMPQSTRSRAVSNPPEFFVSSKTKISFVSLSLQLHRGIRLQVAAADVEGASNIFAADPQRISIPTNPFIQPRCSR